MRPLLYIKSAACPACLQVSFVRRHALRRVLISVLTPTRATWVSGERGPRPWPASAGGEQREVPFICVCSDRRFRPGRRGGNLTTQGPLTARNLGRSKRSKRWPKQKWLGFHAAATHPRRHATPRPLPHPLPPTVASGHASRSTPPSLIDLVPHLAVVSFDLHGR